jgi:hypothetical protein
MEGALVNKAGKDLSVTSVRYMPHSSKSLAILNCLSLALCFVEGGCLNGGKCDLKKCDCPGDYAGNRCEKVWHTIKQIDTTHLVKFCRIAVLYSAECFADYFFSFECYIDMFLSVI